jgi:hypothetical protein
VLERLIISGWRKTGPADANEDLMLLQRKYSCWAMRWNCCNLVYSSSGE